MTQPPTPPYSAPDPQQPYGQQPPPPAYAAPQAPQGYGPFYINVLGQEHGPIEIGQLAQMATSGQIKPETAVRTADNQQYFMAKQVPGLYSDKEWLTTLILSWLLGSLGVDRFYMGYIGLGVLKLVTLGGCGVWHLIDAIMITLRKIPDAEGRPLS